MRKRIVIAISLVLMAVLLLPSGAARAQGEDWVIRYDGPSKGYDEAKAIAVDSSGNVYVTGNSMGLGTNLDICTIKYNSSGVQQWFARYNYASKEDVAYAITVDGSGNVYVAGASKGTTGYDFVTTKYNSSGVEQWASRYNYANKEDVAYAITVDGSGNVYVTGYGKVTGVPLNYDYVTIKYDSAGNEVWNKSYTGAGGNDQAYAIAVDGDGNVYVTGESYTGYVYGTDYMTIKYDGSNGNVLWQKSYDGLGGVGYDAATDLALLGFDVYVTGHSQGTTGYDYATVKYDGSSTTPPAPQWVARYDGNTPYLSYQNMCVDGSGNVYVTGSSAESGSDLDWVTVKYDSSGGDGWSSVEEGLAGADDVTYDIAVDGDGNTYVAGYVTNTGEKVDYMVAEYSCSDGSLMWLASYDGPDGNTDKAYGVAVDSQGNVYATGSSQVSGTDLDYATIKYAGYKPDNQIRNAGEGSYIGDNIYNSDGTDQTKTQNVDNNVMATYEIKLENDGHGSDTLKVTGDAGDSNWTVYYFDALVGGNDITTAVTGSGAEFLLNAGDSVEIRVEVTPDGTVPGGSLKELLVTSTSTEDAARTDTVKASTKVNSYQPDNWIKNSSETEYTGDDIYNTDGTDQMKNRTVNYNQTAKYQIKLENDGATSDNFIVTGTPGSGGWTVEYFDALVGGNDITSAVTVGSYTTSAVAAGESVNLRVQVTPDETVLEGTSLDVLVTSTSNGNGSMQDAVKATTDAAIVYQPDNWIKNSSETEYIGDDIYNSDGTEQTKSQTVDNNVAAIYHLAVQNDCGVSDNFTVTGTPGGGGWAVSYFDALTGGNDITGDVTGLGWNTGSMAPWASQAIRVEVTPDGTIPGGSLLDVLVTSTSEYDVAKQDVVKASTKVTVTAPPADKLLIGMNVRKRGTVNTPEGMLMMTKFKAKKTGTVTEIRVYSRAEGNVKVALYAMSGKVPGDILAANETETPVVAGQWNIIPITPTPVIRYTKYWLAVANDNDGASSRIAKGKSKGEPITFSGFTFEPFPTDLTNEIGKRSIGGWGTIP